MRRVVEAELKEMDELTEDELNYIAYKIQKANKTKACLLYVAFVIFPVALCQYWIGVGVLALVAAIYLALNPDFGRPTRPEVIEFVETEPDSIPPLPGPSQADCGRHTAISAPRVTHTLQEEQSLAQPIATENVIH